MNARNVIRTLILVVCLAVLGVSAYHILSYRQEARASRDLNRTLQETVLTVFPTPEPTRPGEPAEHGEPEKPSPDSLREADEPVSAVDFEALWALNEDVIAWIYCPDTVISYPVVQSGDNDYYLRRLLDGTWNSAGTLFADYRNAGDFSDLHTIIYGHNMRTKAMFGTLPEYESQAYYDAHPVWYLFSPEGNYEIALIAGYQTSANSELYAFEKTGEERARLLETALAQSLFSADVTVADTDRLITLSTCSYEAEEARFVLMGVLRPME